MGAAISMRDLQKMSAEKIRALRGPAPIRCGDETVGLLTPLKRPYPERLEKVLDPIEDHYRALSPDVRRRFAVLIGEAED